MTMTRPLRDRLLSRMIIQPNGCVIWTGAKVSQGYGTIRTEPPESRHRSTHIVMWELFNGPVPDGATLDHLCRNRACANLAHLEPVTIRENILRGTGVAAVNARKLTCPKGHALEANPYAPGERWCRVCANAQQLRRYHARRKS